LWFRAAYAGHQETQPTDGRGPSTAAPRPLTNGGEHVVLLGIVLLIIGFIAAIHILWIIGLVLLVIGAVLFLLGATGRAVGGRKHYF
jgi:hypothetical protein